MSGVAICVKSSKQKQSICGNFGKNQKSSRIKIDKLSEKVDHSVAATEKEGLSKRSKTEKSMDDVIVNLKGDLETIEKKR